MDSNTKRLEQLVNAYEAIKNIDSIKITSLSVNIEIKDVTKRIPTADFDSVNAIVRNTLTNHFNASDSPELVNQTLACIKKEIEKVYANGLTLEEKIKTILQK